MRHTVEHMCLKQWILFDISKIAQMGVLLRHYLSAHVSWPQCQIMVSAFSKCA